MLAFVHDDSPVEQVVTETAPTEQEVDPGSRWCSATQADRGVAIVDGRTTGDMQIRIDGFRWMDIEGGTPGENRCAELAELARCAVAVDLLGEAVLWFSIVPLSPRNLVELPAPLAFTRAASCSSRTTGSCLTPTSSGVTARRTPPR